MRCFSCERLCRGCHPNSSCLCLEVESILFRRSAVEAVVAFYATDTHQKERIISEKTGLLAALTGSDGSFVEKLFFFLSI